MCRSFVSDLLLVRRMAGVCPAQADCLCLRPALVGVGLSRYMHVSPGSEALVLEAPLGVSIFFESTGDGLPLGPQACAEWRGNQALV